jgi:hypothetical protein
MDNSNFLTVTRKSRSPQVAWYIKLLFLESFTFHWRVAAVGFRVASNQLFAWTSNSHVAIIRLAVYISLAISRSR